MTIDELKAGMKTGAVAFSYKKKDGTIREAVGTLCPDLMPKPAQKYDVTDIQWTDSGQHAVDEVLTIEVPADWTKSNSCSTDFDYVADFLTENYGPHIGFQMHEVEKKAKTPNPEVICYYDLTEGHVGWRSFKKSEFIG